MVSGRHRQSATRPNASVARRRLGWLALLLAVLGVIGTAVAVDLAPRSVDEPADGAAERGPPAEQGYFHTLEPGAWSRLPGDDACAQRVHRSTWEPRPDNRGPNQTMPDVAEVRAALRARPVAAEGAYDPRWDSWLLPRVTGQHTGTTDENIQWAACKWGIADNVLRAVVVRESTWFQHEVYPSGRCVVDWGCGDMIERPTAATRVYCAEIGRYGHDYEADYGRGRCPKTFSIAGVMAWQAPEWGRMHGNQNGTFPFSRDSTAFALDYLGSFLRGCYEGWATWLGNTGTGGYGPGDLWGCIGAWYAGEWHSPDAAAYAARVRSELAQRTWLSARWPREGPGCDPVLGCPQGS